MRSASSSAPYSTPDGSDPATTIVLPIRFSANDSFTLGHSSGIFAPKLRQQGILLRRQQNAFVARKLRTATRSRSAANFSRGVAFAEISTRGAAKAAIELHHKRRHNQRLHQSVQDLCRWSFARWLSCYIGDLTKNDRLKRSVRKLHSRLCRRTFLRASSLSSRMDQSARLQSSSRIRQRKLIPRRTVIVEVPEIELVRCTGRQVVRSLELIQSDLRVLLRRHHAGRRCAEPIRRADVRRRTSSTRAHAVRFRPR